MPIHFDRFRLLNRGSRIRNESDKVLYLRAEEPDMPVVVPPEGEAPLPISLEGETLIDVVTEEP